MDTTKEFKCKTTHCLDINNTTELLELHYHDFKLDFELGPAPYYFCSSHSMFID